jgi:HD-GYP domain-containing protein (c-di-GMP phosphodiesterase class II)
MTILTGELMVEPERQYLETLADHLRRNEGVSVRVYDAFGRPVLSPRSSAPATDRAPAANDAACSESSGGCRDFLASACASCRDNATEACVRCPNGRGVRVLPISSSSVYFGSLVACGENASGPGSGRAVLEAMTKILAEQSSKEHEIDSLANELALRYEEIGILYEIDEKIPLRSHTSRVIEYVAEKAFAVINCSCLAWVANGAESDALNASPGECRVFWNPANDHEEDTLLRLEAEQLARSLALRCARESGPVTISNLDNDSDLRAFADALNVVLCLPLVVETDYYGAFVIFKPRGDQFTSYELKLMTALARKSAFVIRDSRLYEDLDALFFNLIKLLVNTIEQKDEYTKGHSQRVRQFTVRLAELLELDRTEIDTLNLSGLLHDIGKQGIPDNVLKKEGKLDDDERALINTHSVRGVNLIKHIKQFERCLPHIRHHHERIDGRGYPDGLRGGQIPLGARIIAVADTFDALTSDRCYRPRFTTDKAFTIIEEVAGAQLDKEIAGLLLDHRDEFSRQVQTAQWSPLAPKRAS